MTTQPKHQDEILEEYQIELGLYKLHETMFGLSAQSRAALKDARPILQQLNETDPDRARRAVECFRLAVSLLREATMTVGDAVDWSAIEELYHPAEDNFIDTPATWPITGRASAQRAANGNGSSNGHPKDNGTAPVPRMAALTIEPPTALDEEPSEEIPAEPKTANRARLAGLGRSLKRDAESEKRRFYVIARDHGMQTGRSARDAMFEALSELFGEELTSHNHLDANKWGRAASAVQMRELCWSSEPAAKSAAPTVP